MNNIQAVISKCIELLHVQINFGSIQFCFMQVWLAQIVLVVLIWSIKKLLDS